MYSVGVIRLSKMINLPGLRPSETQWRDDFCCIALPVCSRLQNMSHSHPTGVKENSK